MWYTCVHCLSAGRDHHKWCSHPLWLQGGRLSLEGVPNCQIIARLLTQRHVTLFQHLAVNKSLTSSPFTNVYPASYCHTLHLHWSMHVRMKCSESFVFTNSLLEINKTYCASIPLVSHPRMCIRRNGVDNLACSVHRGMMKYDRWIGKRFNMCPKKVP